MVIHLSPTLQKRVARAAKAKGIKPDQLVTAALKQYLTEPKPPQVEQVSEARRQLDELLKHMKKPVDFDAAVHQAKRQAGQLYKDNADLIELSAQRVKSHGSTTK